MNTNGRFLKLGSLQRHDSQGKLKITKLSLVYYLKLGFGRGSPGCNYDSDIAWQSQASHVISLGTVFFTLIKKMCEFDAGRIN